MGRFKHSWNVFRKSWNVIGENKKLLLFPAVSFCAVSGVILLTATGTAAGLSGESGEILIRDRNPDGNYNWMWTGAWFLVYLLLSLTANVCTTAFYSEIFRALRGKKVFLLHGFRCAAARITVLTGWTLLASTVGLFLRLFQPRVGGLGLFLFRSAGLIWVVASCFAIPAIVFDPHIRNPFRALKVSSETIRATWGEALIGFAGMRLLAYGAFFIWGVLALTLLSAAWMEPEFFAGVALVIPLLFLVFLAFGYMVFTAEKVYLASLFLYAKGWERGPYSEREMQQAFIPEEE